MLESFNVRNELQYHKLTPEEQQNRGILGRLVGVIADFKNPTRNGRLYTEELWDKQFNSPLMQERLQNRLLLGELGHPEDRQEIDMAKVAICLAEPPKKGSDGKIYGVFDILATPNGKILKTLCDYGCKIGVSSRGSGDTFEGVNGTETVDPDSYECECWDAVVLPSVKSARPKYVTESLDTSRKPLKEALEETIKSATEEEQKTMNETLDELKIDYSQVDVKEASEPVDNIDVAHDDKNECSGEVRDNNYIPNMYRCGVRYHDDLWNADLFLRGGSGADTSGANDWYGNYTQKYVDSNYVTLDMSVSYKASKDLSFYAKGYNLLNKAYAESAGAVNYAYSYPAQGRRFIIGAEYTF